jgi:hypothetical protein
MGILNLQGEVDYYNYINQTVTRNKLTVYLLLRLITTMILNIIISLNKIVPFIATRREISANE